ncbi:MAG: hypothetical protein JWR19_3895 [Pedosphaera sp.]|nr:hypothetical protein [Pedosphaera sp.]
MNNETEYRCCDPRAAAVALGRWCFGIVFLFFGLGKFMGGVGAFAQGLASMYEKTWLPGPLVSAFGHMMPFLEVTLGALLILGIARDVVLFVAGLFLIALTFGQIVLQQAQLIFFNTAYLFMVAVLLFASKYDWWVLGPRCWGRRQAVTGDKVE